MQVLSCSMKHILILTTLTFCATKSQAISTTIACPEIVSGQLQAALDAAGSPGDVVTISGGTCTGNYTINNDLTLTGTIGGNAILDGNNAGIVLTVGAHNVTVSNLTIQHGSGFNGGGIANSGALKLQSVLVQNNLANNAGGGLYSNSSSSLNIEHCSFTNNNQGAIYSEASATTINNSTISSNVATNGTSTAAGITLRNGSLTLSNSTVNGNSGLIAGGLSLGSTTTRFPFTITNSTIEGNKGINGGALISNYQALTFTHVTFTNNAGTNNSGGVFITTSFAAPMTVTASLITGNLLTPIPANAPCPDIRYVGISQPVLNNNITGNSPALCFNQFTTGTGNVVDSNVLLSPLANNSGPTQTVGLGTGSVAIGVVPALSCMTIDQRAAPRPGIGKTACDAGAYETGAPQLTLTLPSTGLLDFGIASAATDLLVEVKSTGNAAVPTQTAQITGAQSAKFSFPVAPDLTPLAVGDSRNYAIRYIPTVNGVDAAALALNALGTNTINVVLQGTGNGFSPPPIASIADLLAYVNAHMGIDLFGVGKKASEQTQKLNAFISMLNAASDAINLGKMTRACNQLQDALEKADGMRRPPDFITGPAVGGVTDQLNALLNYYNCPIKHEHDHDDDNDHHHDRDSTCH